MNRRGTLTQDRRPSLTRSIENMLKYYSVTNIGGSRFGADWGARRHADPQYRLAELFESNCNMMIININMGHKGSDQ